eukprot:gene13291-16951_t
MASAEYRIESQHAIVNRFVPAHRLVRSFGDLSLAVAVAAKSETTPSGGEIRVVHRSGGAPRMKQSLRKTPSLLHLAYKYDGAGGDVTGSHLTLSCHGSLLTLAIDLAGNFRNRDRTT